MKKLGKYLFVLVFILVLLALFVPWKTLLEDKLKRELAARGMEKLEFHIEQLGFNTISLKDISLGEITLPALSINYQPAELLRGNFREIHADEITIHKDKLQIILTGVEASLVTQIWKIANINTSGAPVTLPPLSGAGTIQYADNKIALSGDIASSDKKTKGSFNFDYDLEDANSAILKIAEVFMPWNEGILSSRNISVPINSDKPVSITLGVKQVSLNALLAAATSNRATATGVVSGTIPVVINRDGSFVIKKGDLKADKDGTIKLSPDVIPSDQEQVAMVRDVLKDFHYSLFSMGIESADNKQLVMLLSLEGNNPDVYNGRVVKLNVHLTGDVIDLITQSLNILGQ